MLALAKRLPRSFYARSPLDVAPELLNKVLVGLNGSGRIVEVEAYDGQNDPGSHGYRGETPRTRVMYGPPGFLYVYFTYGMHWCANAVCRPDGECGAVLIRALEPLSGLDAMREARGTVRDRDLCRGPARLCQALGIAGAHNGADLGRGEIAIVDDGVEPPAAPANSTRIGLTNGAELPWRWYVAGNPNVSNFRGGRASARGGRSSTASGS